MSARYQKPRVREIGPSPVLGDSPPLGVPSRLIPGALRARREVLGLSQVELAQRVGVSPTSVNRWENGQTSPHPLTLRTLEQVLGESVSSSLAEAPEGSGTSRALTAPEAAARAGVNPSTISRWVQRGEILACRVGGRYIIDPTSLEDCIQGRALLGAASGAPRPETEVPDALALHDQDLHILATYWSLASQGRGLPALERVAIRVGVTRQRVHQTLQKLAQLLQAGYTWGQLRDASRSRAWRRFRKRTPPVEQHVNLDALPGLDNLAKAILVEAITRSGWFEEGALSTPEGPELTVEFRINGRDLPFLETLEAVSNLLQQETRVRTATFLRNVVEEALCDTEE